MSLEKRLAAINNELRRRLYEQSYYEFFKAAWHTLETTTPLINNKSIKYLCERIQHHCESIIEGNDPEIDLLIINIPPSTSKSSIVTKFLNPWLWVRNASLQILNSSYSSNLSNSHCINSRDIIKSFWYQSYWGHLFDLKDDRNKVTEFANNKTGLRMATSTGGSATGFHFHLVIQDDPLNPGQTASIQKLENAIRFNDKTIPSRLLAGCSFQIIVMQRLHEEDPAGHELRKEEKKIEHICLPATESDIISPKDAINLYEDEILTSRLTRETLKKLKEDLGSIEYLGQYGQSPTNPEGEKLKKSWFQYCELKEVPKRVKWDLWIDGAYTKSTANDPTGLLAPGYDKPTKTLYVRHFHGARMETPELIKFIPDYADLHGISNRSRAYFEPKATGLVIQQYLNKETVLAPVKIGKKAGTNLVSEGKEARIQTAAPKYEAGKIVHIRGAWNDNYEGQLTGCPEAKHDEAVDLIGYGVDIYFKSGRGVTVRN